MRLQTKVLCWRSGNETMKDLALGFNYKLKCGQQSLVARPNPSWIGSGHADSGVKQSLCIMVFEFFHKIIYVVCTTHESLIVTDSGGGDCASGGRE